MEQIFAALTILLPILGIGFVIFIHELGHFVFAKMAGVKVITFSIGFGKVIWSRTIGGTEYAISILPFGGYVRMLGQEDVPGRDVSDTAINPESYLAKSAGWRALILLGGVLFNLISSWLILVGLGFAGMPVFPPRVGEIQPSLVTLEDGERIEVASPASQLDLRRGDIVKSVNDEKVYSHEDVIYGVLRSGTKPVHMVVERNGEEVRLPADGPGFSPIYQADRGRPTLGFAGSNSRNIVNIISGSATSSGIAVGWSVDKVDGVDVTNGDGTDVRSQLIRRYGEPVSLTLSKGGETRIAHIISAGTEPDPFAPVGIAVEIGGFSTTSPARAAGLLTGDILVAVDKETVRSTSQVLGAVQRHVEDDGVIDVSVLRRTADGWQPLSFTVEPFHDKANARYLLGINLAKRVGGELVHFPPAPGSQTNPMSEAGLRPGDVLIGQPLAVDPRTISVTIVRNGSTTSIPLSDDAWERLDHYTIASPISRMFGFKGRPARSGQLHGARVGGVDLEEGTMTLALAAKADGSDGGNVTLAISDLSTADQETLGTLSPGTWIASSRGRNGKDQRVLEVVVGGDEPVTTERLEFAPAPTGTVLRFGPAQETYELQHWTEAFTLANHESVQMVRNTLILIPRFFASSSSGGLDASKSLQGPIGIFTELKARSEHLGFSAFLKLVAVIGLNLFLINLLPIPLVDGGQLLFLGIECIIRRPVPIIVLNIANYIGFFLIISLMLYVVGLDIARQVVGF